MLLNHHLLNIKNAHYSWLNRAYRWLNKSVLSLSEEKLKLLVKSSVIEHNFTDTIMDIDSRFLIKDNQEWIACPWQKWINNIPIMETEFVVVDIECSGSVLGKDAIFELGAIKMKGSKLVDSFHSYVDCQVEIPAYIANMTKVDLSLLRKAPVIEKVMPQLIDFIGSSIFVAHNAEFDFNFIFYEAQLYNIETYPIIDLCTWLLAHHFLKIEGQRYSLDALSSYHKEDLKNHHSALVDARMSAKLLAFFIDQLYAADKNNIFDLLRIDRDEFNSHYNPMRKVKKLSKNKVLL